MTGLFDEPEPHGMGVKVAPRQPPPPVLDPVGSAAPDDIDAAMPTVEHVRLRGGLVVEAAVLRFALALEAQDHRLTTEHGKLIVSQSASLTPEQVAQIKSQRTALVQIVSYTAP